MAVWSIINKSEGLSNKRIDSERYKPQFTENEYLLRNLPHKKLKYFIDDISGGATPRGAKYSLSGIPFVRVQNIKDNYSDLNDVVYIHESIHNGELFRSQIKENDVLLTITGVSYGNSTVAHKQMLPANMNQHSVRISLKNALLPEFLSTFLVSKYGKLQSDSRVTGDTRPALTYSEISNIIIPDIKIENQLKIKKIVNNATNLRIQSQALYKQATDLLEQELGLDKITFEIKKSYIASFSEVVNNNRSDADYYQTKYRQLEKHINSIETVSLSSICTFVKGFEVGTPAYTEVGPTFLRVSNLTKEGFAFGNSDKYISEETFRSLKSYQPKIGDILLTKDGTIGTCYAVDVYVEGIISSGIMNLYLIDSKIPKEYLALVINSKLCQMQAERECSGALITHWKPEQIRNLRIPILKKETMDHLSELCSQSKIARKESKRLLEEAKSRVEQLIEEAANKN